MDSTILTKPTLKKLFSNCRMSKRALVLVEGKDDVPFYDKISQKAKKTTKVIAIETINGYSEGCEKVVEAAKDIQKKLEEEAINEKYFLAVVDADVKRFREEQEAIKGLFYLKYYSYESHFTTKNNLVHLVYSSTSSTSDLINEKFYSYAYDNFNKSAVDILFLASLEALRNAIDKEYNALFGYKTIKGTDTKVSIEYLLNNSVVKKQLEEKKDKLLEFADYYALKYDFETLKSICKGKWLHGYFVEYMIDKIKSLPEQCRNKVVEQCQFCQNDSPEKCLYKSKLNLLSKTIKELSLNNIDHEELDYIIERFKLLI